MGERKNNLTIPLISVLAVGGLIAALFSTTPTKQETLSTGAPLSPDEPIQQTDVSTSSETSSTEFIPRRPHQVATTSNTSQAANTPSMVSSSEEDATDNQPMGADIPPPTLSQEDMERLIGQRIDVAQQAADLGLDPYSVQTFKNTIEQGELELVDLQQQAMKEGWINSEAYQKKHADIIARKNELRQQMGDSEYDRSLYAAGKSNRLVVREVTHNSSASHAGIMPGDVILSYDGRKVYDWSDMRPVAGQKTNNEFVNLAIVRNGETITTRVSSGALGIQTSTLSQNPDKQEKP